MGRMTVTGFEDFESKLMNLSLKINKINRGALGEGAGVAETAMKEAVQALPEHDVRWGTSENQLYGVTADEKAGLVDAVFIKKFTETGLDVSTTVGFGGYVHARSRNKEWEIVAGMLAQCINYGTSFRKPCYTISNAMKAVRQPATDAIEKYINERTEEILNK